MPADVMRKIFSFDMPIFEYVCDKCDHEFETLQKVSESPLKICEACGRKGLRKKISAAGFRLSGSGWYETDFKSGKKKNVSGSDDKGGGEASAKKESSGSNSGSKSDSKSSTSSEKSASKSSNVSKTSNDK